MQCHATSAVLVPPAGQEVRLWDAASGECRSRLFNHSDEVASVVLSPDGSVLATASWDKLVMLFDAGSGAYVGRLGPHGDHVTGMALSADGGLIASGSWDGTVALWRAG